MIKRSAYLLTLSALFLTFLAAGHQISAAAPQVTTGRLVMQSPPGDWVGGGANYDYASPNGTFAVGTSASSGQVDYVRVAYSLDSYNWWWLDFATRHLGVPLLPGTYQDADRYPFERTGHPGLSIAGNGRGCNILSGEFTVQEAVYDYSVSPPRVVRFVADFVQRCETTMPPLTGTITINGDPLPPTATPTSTSTPTATPTSTSTPTATATSTSTSTPTATAMPIETATSTSTATPEAKSATLFLPMVLNLKPRQLVAINPEPIAPRPVVQVGEIYYTTTFTLSAPLPEGGRFYLSAGPDSVSPVKVDDELAVLVDGAEVYKLFLTYPRVVELPRELVESWAGRTITVIFRDAYGSVVGSQPVWLIWAP